MAAPLSPTFSIKSFLSIVTGFIIPKTNIFKFCLILKTNFFNFFVF
jgi:hypothetical protein